MGYTHYDISLDKFNVPLIVLSSIATTLYVTYDMYTRLSNRQKKRILAEIITKRAVEKPFLTYSASRLAEMIRSGEITSLELTQECIQQSKLVEPYINCITDNCFEKALEKAATIDKLISFYRSNNAHNLQRYFDENPFLGVPFYSKECFEVPGFNFTNGLYSMKGNKGKNWNPVVWRTIKSGAILLGAGNISEATMWYESFNNVYGYSNNPYDPSRSVGGSSGGGCALVASLCSPFCLTSDVGGSTRIPSLFNGLFGHKASGGSTPNMRTFDKITEMIERYCQMGVASRHIEDILSLQKIISGPITSEEVTSLKIKSVENPNGHQHKDFSWKREPSVKFDSDVKVYVLENQPRGRTPTSWTEKDQNLARKKVRQAFEENGNEIVDIRIEEFSMAFDFWVVMMGKAEPDTSYAEYLSEGQERTISVLWELIKYFFSFGYASNFTLPLLGLAALDQVGRMAPDMLDTEVSKFNNFKRKMYKLLGTPLDKVSSNERTILLLNSLPFVAPKHGPLPHIFTSADVAATCIFNVLELPATAVPTGIGSKGLPTGVQIVSGYGKDVLGLEAAEFLASKNICKYELPHMI